MRNRAVAKTTGIVLAGVAGLVGIAVVAGAGTATAGATSASSVSSVSNASAASAATDDAISREKAVDIAKKRVPGARVTEVEREREHGHRTWKVELRKGHMEYDVYVSRDTGKIIKFKSEVDDD